MIAVSFGAFAFVYSVRRRPELLTFFLLPARSAGKGNSLGVPPVWCGCCFGEVGVKRRRLIPTRGHRRQGRPRSVKSCHPTPARTRGGVAEWRSGGMEWHT